MGSAPRPTPLIDVTTSNSIKVKALQSAKLLGAAEGLWIIDSSSRGQPGLADSKHVRVRFIVFSQILVSGRFMGPWHANFSFFKSRMCIYFTMRRGRDFWAKNIY